ncbi:substrate-binding domain-containing protein [Nostoc sp. CHAB 5824]|nr:substrate-binding domain-containing protein [Nostoc sp. CHAB 5824]
MHSKGDWEEGLMVQSGNPMEIRTVADLVQAGGGIVNREPGSGSRLLLEQTLQQEQVPFHAVPGFDPYIGSSLHTSAEMIRIVVQS